MYKLLKGYRDRPRADLEGVQTILTSISQLVQDIPEVVELDINPLLVDEHGSVAVDARVVLKPYDHSQAASARLAILPYPKELEEVVETQLGTLLLRPIRPEDENAHFDLVAHVSAEDLRFRLGSAVPEGFSHDQVSRVCAAFIFVGITDVCLRLAVAGTRWHSLHRLTTIWKWR